MQLDYCFRHADDLIVFPDNTQHFHKDLPDVSQIKDPYIIVRKGSLHYPDENADFSRSGSGITIHSVDYDTVIEQRKAYVEDLRVKLSDKGE